MLSRKRFLATLGQNIRSQREARGMTQKEAAEIASISPSYVSSIERGQRDANLHILARLAYAIGIKLSGLCRGLDY